MQAFYIFGIRSVLIGVLFYGIYFFFLKNKAPFKFIRFYLMLALLSMSLLPLLLWLGMPFPKLTFLFNSPVPNEIINGQWLHEVSVGAKSQGTYFGLPFFLLYTYLIIVSILLVRMMWNFISIGLLWKKSVKTKLNGINVAITPGTVPVFSIFNWIFIDRETLNLKDIGLVLIHEKEHIKQRHTLDLFTGEFTRIILWFNPFAHIINKEVKANHEFLADVSVVEISGTYQYYQNLLVQLSTQVNFNMLTHNFSYSLIKRRINMIKKPKTNMRKFKLYSLTTLAMAGVLFACSTNPKTKKQATKISQVKAAPDIKPVKADTTVPQNQVFVVVEKMPTFPGGEKALMSYLGKKIHYPEKAKKEGIHGVVYVNFIVEPDGSIDHVKIGRGIGGGCDLEALNVVKNMPKWNPGEEKGKPVRVKFNLPVKFTLK